jgi:lipid-A-disaccharide synthase
MTQEETGKVSPKLFFSVGEPSGDQHAAHLIGELRRRVPGVQCRGYGGPRMEAAGCALDFELTNLAVMGVFAVVPHLRRFRELAVRAERLLAEQRPDAVVLVDFPGFNWWIARAARKAHIPVIYYCPPQLWAWASWRVHKMRRLVDLALCGLPFEAEWFQRHGVSAECMGHPFFDEVAEQCLDAGFLEAQRGRGPIVGILPGSRRHEVEANFPVQLDVMRHTARRQPDVRFLVAALKPEHRDRCGRMLESAPAEVRARTEVCAGRTSEIIALARVCLMVSGSVSLEMVARRTPAVVLYRASWFFAACAKALVTCRYMSLPNLVAGREVLPEYPVVGDPRRAVPHMVHRLGRWLEDEASRELKVAELEALNREIGGTGGTGRAADRILARIGCVGRAA